MCAYVYVPHFVQPFTIDGHSGWSHLFTVVHSAAVNIRVLVAEPRFATFSAFGYTPRCRECVIIRKKIKGIKRKLLTSRTSHPRVHRTQGIFAEKKESLWSLMFNCYVVFPP